MQTANLEKRRPRARSLRISLPVLTLITIAGIGIALQLGSLQVQASSPQLVRGISDGRFFNSDEPALMSLAAGRARRAGVSIVRLQLNWRLVIKPGTTVGGDRSDPANPLYSWQRFDRIVRNAVDSGLRPLVTLTRTPNFAESEPRWPFARPGTWLPDHREYAAFAKAAALRYSGAYPDPVIPGRFLPRIRYWQAWNEPNLPGYLQPQWLAYNGHWRAYSPIHYRRLLNAFAQSVKAVRKDNLVVTAGTAPNGSPQDGEGRMAPARFLRAFFCLGKPPRLKPFRCTDPPRFDVLAHHPFSSQHPDRRSSYPDDVAVADMHKLKSILRAAERASHVRPRGKKRIWVTEINWDSLRGANQGVPKRLQPRWVSRALYRLWFEGVDTVVWHFLSDPDYDMNGFRDHPGGLYQSSPKGHTYDKPKRMLSGFSFPFTAKRLDRRRVEVWGLLPKRKSRSAVIERRSGRKWRVIEKVKVNRYGMLRGTVRFKGTDKLRASVPRLDISSPAWKIS